MGVLYLQKRKIQIPPPLITENALVLAACVQGFSLDCAAAAACAGRQCSPAPGWTL